MAERRSPLKLPNLMKAGSAGLAAVALSMVMLAGAPPSQAMDGRERCQHHIQKAEARLDEAVRRHGERSHQAEERRRDLNAERDHCWNQYHAWWNGHENRWHEQRDWDLNIVVR
jgi:hypothetical protein